MSNFVTLNDFQNQQQHQLISNSNSNNNSNFLLSIKCSSCRDPINDDLNINNNQQQSIVNANGETYHSYCFVCAQCFQPFQDGIFYEYENRKYCDLDFKLLFAPICGGCKNYIDGRVIKAMNVTWHPECFCCHSCGVLLLESGFIKNSVQNKPFCKECNMKEKLKNSTNTNQTICNKCSMIIMDHENELIRYKGDTYHAFHFECSLCQCELNAKNSRELRNQLYCLKCHDKLDIPICSACHTPIDQERIVYALGKQWHVEHFACNKCEIPFNGSRHFEKKGQAYCELHYNQLFGNLCFQCNKTICGDVYSAMNKSFCVEHFQCYLCDDLMNQKTKFYDLDCKPVCKHCFDRLPSKIRTNILNTNNETTTNNSQHNQQNTSTITNNNNSNNGLFSFVIKKDK